MAITEARKKALEEERRQLISSTAMRLFFEKGYRNTSISDIAKASCISKGLVYHYYASKAELLFSFQTKLDACLDEIRAIPSAREAILEFGRRFLLVELDENGYIPPLQVFLIVFIKGEMDDAAYMDRNPLYQDFGNSFFAPLFRRGIESGEFRSGDPELYGDIYWHYLVGNILELLESRNKSQGSPDLERMLSLFAASE